MKLDQRMKRIEERRESPTQKGIFEDFFRTGHGSHEKAVIDEVCKRHRISQATFYNYYAKFNWKDRVKQRTFELLAREKAETTKELIKRHESWKTVEASKRRAILSPPDI